LQRVLCRWQNWKTLSNWMGTRYKRALAGGLSVRFESEPGCFENGMVCRILKPGTYSYLARGRGTIHWEDTFEIKENQCLKIRLGRRN
tara:strand:+ start:319 stop:582 length:264 start_codon:yes stop_codon:yes gene_type:complete